MSARVTDNGPHIVQPLVCFNCLQLNWNEASVVIKSCYYDVVHERYFWRRLYMSFICRLENIGRIATTTSVFILNISISARVRDNGTHIVQTLVCFSSSQFNWNETSVVNWFLQPFEYCFFFIFVITCSSDKLHQWNSG